jgi:alpha-maltose-1-phosphate synthase
MQVSLSTWNRFHFYDLAQQLNRLDSLHSLCSTLPRFRAEKDVIFNSVDKQKLQTYPYFFVLQILLSKVIRDFWLNEYAAVNTTKTFQNYVKHYLARNIDSIDAYIGISGSGYKGGQYMVEQGKVYCFDRGSTEITYQLSLMEQLHRELSLPCRQVHPFLIENETQEAQVANAITVPSQFCKKTFIEKGFSADKIHVINYGVNLNDFYPDSPAKETIHKQLIFCGQFSIRKGAHVLIDYFRTKPYLGSGLKVVGSVNPNLKKLYSSLSIANIDFVGVIPRLQVHRFMKDSAALILPSFEEGLALVIPQALACGVPVIGSVQSGATEYVRDGYNGFILDDISTQSIDLAVRKLFALSPDEYEQMSANCLASVKNLGGWDDYGQKWYALLEKLLRDKSMNSFIDTEYA